MFGFKSFVYALGLSAIADAAITLGTASQYGVFAASTITNTGNTNINARIGLNPGTSITGFPPGVNQGQDVNNAASTQAKSDIQSAYNAIVALAVTTDLTGQDLGGKTLTPGVYGFSSSGGLTGTLTLDAQGNPNAQFIFKFGSTITTASASQVVLVNGAQACNVFWQVGSSATLGTTTSFQGNVIAQASITATTGVTVGQGGLYALTAAVTLDTNTIDAPGSCAAVKVVVSSTSSSAAAPAATVTSTATVTVTSTSTQAASGAATITVVSTVSGTASATRTITITTTKTSTTTRTSTTTKTTTKTSTTTKTKTAACTANAKRDYQRMFQ